MSALFNRHAAAFSCLDVFLPPARTTGRVRFVATTGQLAPHPDTSQDLASAAIQSIGKLALAKDPSEQRARLSTSGEKEEASSSNLAPASENGEDASSGAVARKKKPKVCLQRFYSKLVSV
jgi:hypothetical protein